MANKREPPLEDQSARRWGFGNRLQLTGLIKASARKFTITFSTRTILRILLLPSSTCSTLPRANQSLPSILNHNSPTDIASWIYYSNHRRPDLQQINVHEISFGIVSACVDYIRAIIRPFERFLKTMFGTQKCWIMFSPMKRLIQTCCSRRKLDPYLFKWRLCILFRVFLIQQFSLLVFIKARICDMLNNGKAGSNEN